MAQSSTHGLLAESTSIEYVPRLSPPTPRDPSYSSTSSIDSATNYSPQGEATEGIAPPSTLPTFYPSGSRDVTPSSDPDKSPRNWPDILFRGWRVVLLSCMSFLSSSLDHLTKLIRFKGSMYFWCSFQYPCVSTRSLIVDRHSNLHHLVGDDALYKKHA
jgi:hypothetical protein